ncbi:hypothetical protein LEP1GSC145_4045 [Leptospira interrogans serovar Djasiman str. LT1649]|nr:hypothetical protein LEP1GSC145_4045 [Leptospira interrogans serovar Djasiman str. LT1649]
MYFLVVPTLQSLTGKLTITKVHTFIFLNIIKLKITCL